MGYFHKVVFTCKHCEVRGASDGDEGRCDVGCLHSILSHPIQVRGLNISVVVPPEAIEGDEQQLVPGRPSEERLQPRIRVTCWGSSTGRAGDAAEHSKAEQQLD